MKIRTATVTILGVTPYSPSRRHDAPRMDSETKDSAGAEAYERRTWREKCHADEAGNVFIPPMAFKRAMDEQSKKLGKIPGKGHATWTKPFTQGTMILGEVFIGRTKADAVPEAIQAHPDGKRSCPTRVVRIFPMFPKWGGQVRVEVYDDLIKAEQLGEVFGLIGIFNGVGRFRPANGGYLGRFSVEEIVWD